MTVLPWVWLGGGAFLLYIGAEWLVAGASRLALALRIPPVLVGITVVAYGTSAPEAVVGLQAALTGRGSVAFGNIVGSNLANLGLILGIAALGRGAQVDGQLRRREVPMLLFTAALVPLVALDGVVTVSEGACLLGGTVLYTVWLVVGFRQATALADGAPMRTPCSVMLRQLLLAFVGLVVLAVGGWLFIDGATQVALWLGISQRLVGLTIVAVGTSLPELATTIIAMLRGHLALAVGNVVGSNIFNVFLCLGSVGATGRLSRVGLTMDVFVMVGLTVMGAFFLRRQRTLRRWEGVLLLLVYVVFLGALFQ